MNTDRVGMPFLVFDGYIKMKTKDRLLDLFCCFLFMSTLFVFLPAQVYYNNVAQYSYFFYEYLVYALLVLILSLVLFSIFVFLFKDRVRILPVLMVSLTFLCILQANVLSWDYGVFDGSEIDWKQHAWQGVVDLLLWIGVLCTAVIFHKLIYKKYLKGIALFLFLFQLLSVSYVALHYNLSENSKNDYLKINYPDNSRNFSFSRQDNILIILLDTYRSDIFDEIIAEDGFYGNIFKDFIYYRNNIGGYPTTYPSIPLLMTGKYFKNDMPIRKFIEKEYLSGSLPKVFLQKGYDVSLVPFDRMIYPSSEISDNFVRKKNNIREMIETARNSNLNQVVFFICMPTYVRAFLIDKVQFYNDDLDFIRKFKEKYSSDNTRNTFKFYHLRGGHPPLVIDENLNMKRLPYNRESYKAQAKADLKICSQIFEYLKRDKIFDHTLIVVMSDHGYPDCEMINRLNNRDPQEDTVIKTAIPLLLVKERKSQQARIRISDQPTTNADLKSIVMGAPALSFNNDRRYYYYDWKHEHWRSDYLPPFTEYRVTGHAWDKESWTPTGNILTKQGVVKKNIIN